MQFYILHARLAHFTQQHCHAVDIGFYAKKLNVRIGQSLMHQMLAAAEANFQPERLARRDVMHIEQAALGIIRAGDPADAELGQIFFQVTLLRGIESLAFDAPIKISMFHSPSLTKKGAPARTRLVTY